MATTSMLDEYLNYYENYKKIYGEKICILYQNGNFYEIMGVEPQDPSPTEKKQGNCTEIASLLDLRVATKTNYLMCGFQLMSHEKFTTQLSEMFGYVVVTVSQFDDEIDESGKGKKVKRKIRRVTEVISPSTNIGYLKGISNNYLVSIYIDFFRSYKQKKLYYPQYNIGISAIDVSTGEDHIFPLNVSSNEDENKSLDDVYRILAMLKPREIILNIQDKKLEFPFSLKELSAYWEVPDNVMVHFSGFNTIPSDFAKVGYQDTFLKKIFSASQVLELNNEFSKYPESAISYVSLLDYCYTQNESFLKDLEFPSFHRDEEILVLDNNSIEQLDIFHGSKDSKTLHSYLNLCSTSFGKRSFKNRLLAPIYSVEELGKRYDTIDFFLKTVVATVDEKKSKFFPQQKEIYIFEKSEEYLKHIYDIERLHRKIALKMIHPDEFNILDDSYKNIINLLKFLNDNQTELNLVDVQAVQDMVSSYKAVLKMEETPQNKLNNIKSFFINPGYSQELDLLFSTYQECEAFFKGLTSSISQLIKTPEKKTSKKKKEEDDDEKEVEGLCYYDKTDQDGYYLEITCKRYQTAQSKFPKTFEIPLPGEGKKLLISPEEFVLSPNKNKTKYKITSPLIDEMSKKWTDCVERRDKVLLQTFNRFLGDFYTQNKVLLKDLVRSIAEVDIYKSCAKAAQKYKYCRPSILAKKEKEEKEKSYFRAKQLRHAIIERYDQGSHYIPQDIDMDEKNRGILLFGLNQSGKSVTMKAVGLAVVMAQAGMYVPAESFEFYPYKILLTRILGNDNMSKGMSSFATEVMELKGIMARTSASGFSAINGERYSNADRSLVLGDEINRGCDYISALSITAAIILKLSELNCNFLFATHLHSLSKIPRITELENVSMYHLRSIIEENPETGQTKITYERVLQPGPGLSMYGIQVAKCLGLERSVIDVAFDIRREVLQLDDHFVNTKASRYNGKVYMDQCGIPECARKSEETHHIRFQKDADAQGFNGSLPKNSRANLIPLCEVHHQMVHVGSLIIRGYRDTTDGMELDYEIN